MKHTSIAYKIFAGVAGVVVIAALLVAFQLTYTDTTHRSANQIAVSDEAAEIERQLNAPAGMGGSVEEYAGDDASIGMPIPEPTAGQTAADVEQRIIKTGSLSMVVDRVNETVQDIENVVQEIDGFVQSSSVSERGDGTYAGSITVRVPVDRLEEAMDRIKTMANVVEREQTTGQDVTEQYTDMESRLQNAEAQEDRYLELLDQADDVEDILAIEQQLHQIRNEVEYLQGRLQSLENQTAYSTINISLSEEPRIQGPTREFRPLSSMNEAVQSLIQLGQQFVIGLIWVIVVGGGIAIPIAVLGWAIYKIVKLFKRRNE